jgi:hypothetical protein
VITQVARLALIELSVMEQRIALLGTSLAGADRAYC